MIKSIRYFKLAIRKLLPKKVRMELKERTRYISVNPDSFIARESKVPLTKLCHILEPKQNLYDSETVQYTDGFFSSTEDSD